mmetsp:Transcript_4982/g.14712  ORF Transcript_4982/g.14712 Transcript_4982/m.14712 type:complete len:226 (-) Transcript_4982:710-1387(-)
MASVPPRRLSSSAMSSATTVSSSPRPSAASVRPSWRVSMRSMRSRISPRADSDLVSSASRALAEPCASSALPCHCCTCSCAWLSLTCASCNCSLSCESAASASRCWLSSLAERSALDCSRARSLLESLSEKDCTASVYCCSCFTSRCMSASCLSCVRRESLWPWRAGDGGAPLASAAADRSSSRVKPFSTRLRKVCVCCGVPGRGGTCASMGDTCAVDAALASTL